MNQCETRDAVGQRCLRPAGHKAESTNIYGNTIVNPHGAHDFGGVYPDAKHQWEWLADQRVERAEKREDLVDRLIGAAATAFALAVANGRWAHEEHRRAAALIEASIVVAERMACDHQPRLGVEVDPECGRCEWMAPFRAALAEAQAPSTKAETI